MRNNNLLILFSALCIVAILAGGITGFAIQASRASIGKLSASRQLTQEPSQLRIDMSRIAVKPALQADSIQSRLKLKMNLADAPASKSTAYKPSGEIQGAVLYRITSNGELANYVPSKPVSLMTTDSLTGNPWTDFSETHAENCITFRSDTDITIKPCRFRKYLVVYSEGAEGLQDDNGLLMTLIVNSVMHHIYLPKTAQDKAYVGVGPYSGNKYSTYCYKNLDVLAKSESAYEKGITSCDDSQSSDIQELPENEKTEEAQPEPQQSGAVLVKDVTNAVHFDTSDPFLNELKASSHSGYKVVINAGKDEDGTRVSMGEFDFKTGVYTDFPGATASSPSILRLYFYPLDTPAIKIPAGKKMRIYYDGGLAADAYLPEIDETSEVYVGADGSTYFDATLTQKAAGSQQSRAMTSSESQSASPLKMKDLESISVSIHTSENYEISIGSNLDPFGRIEINKVEVGGTKVNEYKDDWEREEPLEAWISFIPVWTKESQVDYILTQAGDTLTMTYDGGKITTLILPKIIYNKYRGIIINNLGYGSLNFYISLDGLLYIDKALTNLVGTSSSSSSQEPVPQELENTCSDSDGGRDYNKKGDLTDSNGKLLTHDCCSNGPHSTNCEASGEYLVERFCIGNDFDYEIFKCQYGCKSGQCSSKPKSNLLCDKINGVEGWYTSSGKLVKAEKCIGCEAVCKNVGNKNEGWYNSCTGVLVQQGKCNSLWTRLLRFFGWGKSKSTNQAQEEATIEQPAQTETTMQATGAACSRALGYGYQADGTLINSEKAERIKIGDMMYQCGWGEMGNSAGAICNAELQMCCGYVDETGQYQDCTSPRSQSIPGKVCRQSQPSGLYAPVLESIYWHSTCLDNANQNFNWEESNPYNCLYDPLMKIEDCPNGCSGGICL